MFSGSSLMSAQKRSIPSGPSCVGSSVVYFLNQQISLLVLNLDSSGVCLDRLDDVVFALFALVVSAISEVAVAARLFGRGIVACTY